MNIHVQYTSGQEEFTEDVVNVGTNHKELFFYIRSEIVTVQIKDLKCVTIYANNWKHIIKNWRFGYGVDEYFKETE